MIMALFFTFVFVCFEITTMLRRTIVVNYPLANVVLVETESAFQPGTFMTKHYNFHHTGLTDNHGGDSIRLRYRISSMSEKYQWI